MRKTFCDKCGKEITTDVEWVFNHELCSKCAEAVDIFITHPSGPSTVDVQTAKHGKWDGYICSECSVCADYFISGDFYYFDEKPNFCPNCGADMRGDTYD